MTATIQLGNLQSLEIIGKIRPKSSCWRPAPVGSQIEFVLVFVVVAPLLETGIVAIGVQGLLCHDWRVSNAARYFLAASLSRHISFMFQFVSLSQLI